jgi:hypothetical protein
MIRKDNIEQTLDRRLAFYDRRLEDGILATIIPSGGKEADVGPTRVRDCLLLSDLEGCLRRAQDGDITDWLCDYVPTVYPTVYFGESIWSGMFGGELQFSGNDVHTWSYCAKPVIERAEAFRFPEVSRSNYWFDQMLTVTEYFVKGLEPAFDIMHFVFDDCLNLLVELRGATAAYMDIYDRPDFVHRFMDWSTDENTRVFDAQADLTKDLVREAYGGHPCYKYAACNVPDIGVDAYSLCHSEIFEEFGLKQYERTVARYGGARMHIHSPGQHLCSLVSTIDGLIVCTMTDDSGYVPPYTIVEALKEAMHPVPVRVTMPKEVFVDRLHDRSLPGAVEYLVPDASDVAEANDIMLRVFDYRPRSTC